MIGIGIETSCDESAAAIVEDGRRCLANVIFSQAKEHAPFRGVVPELASRAHMEKIGYVYEEALGQASLSISSVDYIALSAEPGLVGSLMVGAAFAKSLAIVSGLPIILVNHLEAHLYSVYLEGKEISYPSIGLLLSGGNSSIYRMDAPASLCMLADTMDDACGEAFDKLASILDLPYPGGPSVEKKADNYAKKTGRPASPSLFTPLLKNLSEDEMAFSFSGIKTAAKRALESQADPEKICYDFQNTIFDLIERNLIKACKKTAIQSIIAGGGVLANQSLRTRLDILAKSEGICLSYPQSRAYCTDNAAMVASLGYFLRGKGEPWETKSLGFDVAPSNLLL